MATVSKYGHGAVWLYIRFPWISMNSSVSYSILVFWYLRSPGRRVWILVLLWGTGPAPPRRRRASIADVAPTSATEGIGNRHGERANLTGLVLGCIEANFARKYAFESSRRDLHNAHLCTALLAQCFWQYFAMCFCKILENFNSTNLAEILKKC